MRVAHLDSVTFSKLEGQKELGQGNESWASRIIVTIFFSDPERCPCRELDWCNPFKEIWVKGMLVNGMKQLSL
jgi:hypothetical protein